MHATAACGHAAPPLRVVFVSPYCYALAATRSQVVEKSLAVSPPAQHSDWADRYSGTKSSWTTIFTSWTNQLPMLAHAGLVGLALAKGAQE